MSLVADRLPEGTEILEPKDWFDECVLGYAFNQSGGVSACYSAEMCVSIIRGRLGLDEVKASEFLAKKLEGFSGGGVPVFVWGLDQVAKEEKPKLVLAR